MLIATGPHIYPPTQKDVILSITAAPKKEDCVKFHVGGVPFATIFCWFSTFFIYMWGVRCNVHNIYPLK